jgi:DNA-binding IclR family transcriptional regulator
LLYCCVMSNQRETRAGEPGPAVVQSVDRALNILEILARRHDAGVTEIGKDLGVHKSTAFRLLAVLENRGFVEQAEDRGTYRLGFGIVRLAGAITAQLDVTKQGREACERLAADLGDTVNIAILDGHRAVNISQSRGAAAIASHNWIGQQTPLHATSSGKILLAFGPATVRASVLAGQLERFTDEEYESGHIAVAAPVRGADGSVIAALSVSGPAYRLATESFPAIAKRVVEAADEVSLQMGYVR